ncbi:hypothetical protein LXL04_035143 [Taraxacum kok-saghyz]
MNETHFDPYEDDPSLVDSRWKYLHNCWKTIYNTHSDCMGTVEANKGLNWEDRWHWRDRINYRKNLTAREDNFMEKPINNPYGKEIEQMTSTFYVRTYHYLLIPKHYGNFFPD